MEITDDAISDLAVTIDSNQDGSIDIDEFMEAFRLTDKKSRLERGRSMFMGTATDLTKLDVDPNIWKHCGKGGQARATLTCRNPPQKGEEDTRLVQAALVTHT